MPWCHREPAGSAPPPPRRPGISAREKRSCIPWAPPRARGPVFPHFLKGPPMSFSFRPTLEQLEHRWVPATNPAQSLFAVPVADAQHALLHAQLIANKAEAAGVQAVIRLEQQVAPLLHGQLAAGLQSDIRVHQGSLAALQQQAATLNGQ